MAVHRDDDAEVILLHSQENPLFAQARLRDWKLVIGVLKAGRIVKRYCLVMNITSSSLKVAELVTLNVVFIVTQVFVRSR